MPTIEEWVHAGWHQGLQGVRRRAWKLAHATTAESERLAAQLWTEARPEPRFGAVIDILGFSALMRRYPSDAHVQLEQLGRHVAEAIRTHGGGAVAAAVFSDSAYLDSDDVRALADVAREVLFLALVRTPSMLVHGLIAQGDYRLLLGSHAAPGSPGRPGASGGIVAQVHWAGQGVLEIGWKEKLLPKGAMIFLDTTAEAAARVAGVPTVPSPLLWSTRRALDWTADPARRRFLRTAWGNVKRNPEYISHVRATRQWLTQVAALHGVALE